MTRSKEAGGSGGHGSVRSPAPHPRRSSTPSTLMVGFVLGTLTAVLVIPARQGTETITVRAPSAEAPQTPDAPGTTPAAPPAATTVDPATGDAPAGEGSERPATSPSEPGQAPATSGTAPAATQTDQPEEDAPETSTQPVRGVTDEAIKLGVAVLDLSALQALGPQFDPGDIEEHWEAMLDRWRREGILPIGGRDIELVFRSYNVLSAEEQRAACVSLVQDAKVFAVIAVTGFTEGAECVAREHQTPLLTLSAPDEAMFERSWPFLFTMDWSQDRILRNMVHWAHHRGLLAGKKIGIYYRSDAVSQRVVQDNLKGELASLGYDVAAEATTGEDFGGPQDGLAVQRFRSAGVDLAILLTSKSGFMQQAQAQGYRPTYIESDYGAGTSDVIAATHPPQQFDGTYGITGQTRGEAAAGMGLTAGQEACLSNYERYSGNTVDRPEEDEPEGSAEFAYVLNSCDEGTALIHSLTHAGRDLTPLRFVEGLETMRQVDMLRSAKVLTFDRERHDGTDAQRTLQWHAECGCWKAIGEFAPLFVP